MRRWRLRERVANCGIKGALDRRTNGALSFSHALATPSGRGQVVVVAVVSDGSSQSASATSSASYDGKSMTLAKQVWSGSRVTASIYYIKDASLESARNAYTDIVISGGDLRQDRQCGYELRGIDQTTVVEATGGSSGGDCASDDPSDTLTTATANDFIVQ